MLTESDTASRTLLARGFFAARISFLFGTRIGISHEASFFTQLIGKLLHGWERKTAPQCLVRQRPLAMPYFGYASRAKGKRTPYCRRASAKKPKHKFQIQRSGYVIVCPFIVNSKTYTAFQGASAYADFDCGRHDVVRTGLRQLCSNAAVGKCVGEAKDCREAVALALQTNQNVVVMDIGMPELTVWRQRVQIAKGFPHGKCIPSASFR